MRLTDIEAGQTVLTDAGFTCMDQGEHVVKADKQGFYLDCQDGKHYLDGQLDEQGHLVGISPAN
jgi:hypothetical protein